MKRVGAGANVHARRLPGPVFGSELLLYWGYIGVMEKKLETAM